MLSEEIGCVEDLVISGVNGATFHAGDVEGLATALKPLLVYPDGRARASRASRERIEQWSYRECAVALESAIARACERRGLGGNA